MWVQIAILVVSLLISAFARPSKPQAPKPAAFADFDFPQYKEGTAKIVVFGDVWLDEWMVIGIGNYRTTAIRR